MLSWDSENCIFFQNSMTFQFSPYCSVTFCLAVNYFSACRLGKSQAQITTQKAIGAVKHDFPFINPCWVFPATSLSLMCFEMFSSSIYSIIFPRTEVNLTGLLFPEPFFLSSLKTGVTIVFSQCLRTSQHQNISKTIRSDIRLPSANSHL